MTEFPKPYRLRIRIANPRHRPNNEASNTTLVTNAGNVFFPNGVLTWHTNSPQLVVRCSRASLAWLCTTGGTPGLDSRAHPEGPLCAGTPQMAPGCGDGGLVARPSLHFPSGYRQPRLRLDWQAANKYLCGGQVPPPLSPTIIKSQSVGRQRSRNDTTSQWDLIIMVKQPQGGTCRTN